MRGDQSEKLPVVNQMELAGGGFDNGNRSGRRDEWDDGRGVC